MTEIEVAHEDDHLLVVVKPTGLATTAPRGGDCLTRRLEEGRRETLHATSRLDREVTGLVTFARTKAAIMALKEARARGAYRRLYLALSERAPEPASGVWDASIAIDPRDRRLRVVSDVGERVKAASTDYAIDQLGARAVRLALRPHTGRTHQLRVHAAHAGCPLLGDHRYGGPKRVVLDDGRVVTLRRAMLHCARLALPRIDVEGELVIESAPPADFQRAWSSLA